MTDKKEQGSSSLRAYIDGLKNVSVPLPESLSNLNVFDGKLYHYTTAEGLWGIIDKGCLHAGAAFCMNDSSEVAYGHALLRMVVAQWLMERGERGGLAKELAETMRAAAYSDFTDIFVVCFCEKDNLLSQWRAYGQTGGYSLEFALNSKKIPLSTNDQSYTIELRRVIYSREDQLKILVAKLTALLGYVDESETKVPEGDTGDNALNIITHIIVLDAIMAEICAFKNSAFEDEREWRLVIRQRYYEQLQQLLKGQDITTDHEFKVNRGIVMPFVKLLPRGTDANILPIKGVRFGPSLLKARTESALKLFLMKNKYKEAAENVRGSEIPVVL